MEGRLAQKQGDHEETQQMHKLCILEAEWVLFTDGLNVQIGERKKSRISLRPKYPSTDECTNIMWYILSNPTIKRSEIHVHATTRTNLENITLSQKYES